MEEVEKDTSRSTVTECSPETPPACLSLFSPNPSIGRNAQAQQKRQRVATRRRTVGRNNELCCPSGKGGGLGDAGKKVLDRVKTKQNKKETEEHKKVLSRQHSRATKDPDRGLCDRSKY